MKLLISPLKLNHTVYRTIAAVLICSGVMVFGASKSRNSAPSKQAAANTSKWLPSNSGIHGVTTRSSTNLGDVAVNVNNVTIGKLSAADGTMLWSKSVPNDGALAVDPSDLGVYTGNGSHSFGGAGNVYKYDASGNVGWSNSVTHSGGCNFYYVNNAAVDATSSSPGVVWTEGGCFGGMAKSDRSNGAQQWSALTNDIGTASIDPVNGQIYAITNAGSQYNYNTLYSAAADGSSVNSASSCEGYTDLNPADGMLYRGGNGCGTTLSQMNKSSLGATNWSMDLSSSISSFDALAVQPWSGGHVYVGSGTDKKIVVVDPATQTVVRTVSTAIAAYSIAVDPFGGNIYIADRSSHFVYAYSPTGQLVWTSADLGAAVNGVATPRDIVGGPVSASSLVIAAGSGGIRTGDGFTLGTRFFVGNQDETVSALGVWDGPNGAGSIGDGLQASKPVAIWDGGGNVIASGIVPAGTSGVLVGEFRYVAISPVILLANQQYTMGAYYASGDPDSLRDQGGGPVLSGDFNSYAGVYSTSAGAGSISEPTNAVSPTYVGPSFLYGGSCVTPPSDVIAWWPGDGNTKDLAGGNTGQLKNGATFGTGEVSQAFSLDGQNDYVDVAPGVTLTSTFTFDAWINPADVTNLRALISKQGNGSPGYSVLVYNGAIILLVTNASGGNTEYATTDGAGNFNGVVTTNVYQHVAVTYNDSAGNGARVKIYLNGIAQTVQPLSGQDSGGAPGAIAIDTKIGAFGVDSGPTYFYNGLIDEIELFNRALSVDEIQSIYYAGSLGKCKPTCITPPTGLVSWWPGDNTAIDIQGGNNGALYGTATFADGKVGRAFSFDGSGGSYVGIDTGPQLVGYSAFTVDAWFNRTEWGRSPHLHRVQQLE